MNPIHPTQGVLVQNDNAAAIPQRSAVVVTSLAYSAATDTQEAGTVFHVDQYDGTQFGQVLVTGQAAIQSGATGRAFFDEFIYVAVDGSLSDPVIGEMWGPVPGAWTIYRGGIGFICVGYVNNGSAPKGAYFKRIAPTFLNGKTTSSLSAGSLTSPSNCTVNVWLPSGSTAGTGYAVATQSGFLGITAYNYFPSFSGSSGLTCQIEPYGSRWALRSLNCA